MAARSTRLSLRRKPNTNTKKEEKITKVTFISDNEIEKVISKIESLPDLIKSKSQLKTESAELSTRSRRKLKKSSESEVNKSEEDTENQNEEFLDSGDEMCEKPKDLCDEDDIGGDEICSFRTPRKRKGMILKAMDSASKCKDSGTPNKRTPSKISTPTRALTPRSSKLARTPSKQPVTPRNSIHTRRSARTLLEKTPSNTNTSPNKRTSDTKTLLKTPYSLRVKQKQAIKVYRKCLENSDSDYEGSGDESSNSDLDSEEEDSESDSGKGSEGPQTSCRRSHRFQPIPATSSSKPKGKDMNYVFAADEFFESKSSKCKTSDHVLSRLKTPRLDHVDIVRLLKGSSMSQAHCAALGKLRAIDFSMFRRWMIALSQGFSILAYGLGSKYKILQNFQREMLPDSHVLVVNGFFPSLSIKEIVDSIASDLLGLKQTLPTPHAIIDWIECRRWMPRVFLLIHNIDAEPLRCDKTQQILARLASLPRVHLIASIDHINAPLLWDQAKLSAFNFMWEDTTSFLPYQEETSYENSLMVHNSGSLALSSLLSVYRSLPQNSRGVFRIILQKHLDENSPKYAGMPFSELYGRCREEMLVTSDLVLRTMLNEFLDHEMVKYRRDNDHLFIPTDIGVLKQFHNLIKDD